MNHMQVEYEFCASKAQYERHFKLWKFRKNSKAANWNAIHYRVQKRKREGKESEGIENIIESVYSRIQDVALERSDEEHLSIIKKMSGCSYDEMLLQFLKHIVHLSSNNMLRRQDNIMEWHDSKKIIQWIDRHDGHAMLESLLSIKLPTVEAFAEHLFREAVYASNARITKILLHAGVNPSLPMYYGPRYPLKMAIIRGNAKLAQVLLDAGADANADTSGDIHKDTLLQTAAKGGDVELVKLLLNAGAHVNASAAAWDGRTALQAASRNSIELVKILLHAGADVNAPQLK
ncbi:hypothetical protein H2199_008871 [Coniosporium tulheliwenetii]|uniref:Uncharacterized protein n=1 Tax=Coniosporium tulheliwenetii TaxID=3383036 RepID=A0ACC2YH88_9PEZI|nr:hypothetical protein H2199_008871 [Cladosporium sp. JES 115]